MEENTSTHAQDTDAVGILYQAFQDSMLESCKEVARKRAVEILGDGYSKEACDKYAELAFDCFISNVFGKQLDEKYVEQSLKSINELIEQHEEAN